eukprot:1195390-Prorocentrum_minimum.AAC.1
MVRVMTKLDQSAERNQRVTTYTSYEPGRVLSIVSHTYRCRRRIPAPGCRRPPSGCSRRKCPILGRSARAAAGAGSRARR